MEDQQRTKILALGLGAVVAVYSLRSTVDGYLMKPIRDLQTSLKSAQFENETLAQQKIQLQVAQRNLDDWKAISLPQEIDDAQRLYREWVYELTRQCGFTGPGFEVTPGSRSLQKEFSTVAVEVKKAETDLQGLTRFLYLFDQAALLQRISAMKIDSPGAQGNPRLVVSFTAEGMGVVGSEDKKELLPRSTLTTTLTESATAVTVAANESFPTWDPFEPFLIRIDRELMKVESVEEGQWKIQRGVHGTKVAAHEEQAIVELLPVSWNRKEVALEQYADFVKASLFVIPSPPKTWNPRLAGVSDKTIKPGEEIKFTARAENFNPDLGVPQFSLTEPAEGMTIDPATGEFSWKPVETLAAGKYSATVLVSQANNPDVKLDSKLTITIKSTNAAPVLTIPEAAIVIIGREFSTQASATDDGPVTSLKYSLGNGAPEGLKIDATSGAITWTPERTLTPGKYDVEVKVTDAGEEPKVGSGKISLDVKDDDASLTLLSAAISKDDVWVAWFRNKGTGKTDRLKIGETLTVAEISAELVSVTNRFVTLKDAEGIWKLSLGDILRDRKLIEPAPKPESVQPAEQLPSTQPPADELPASDTEEGVAADGVEVNVTESTKSESPNATAADADAAGADGTVAADANAGNSGSR